MNNYVIINADDIQKRIDELESKIPYGLESYSDFENFGRLAALEELLSNSIPLMPEIEKAYYEGTSFMEGNGSYLKDYVSHLKFDI